MLDIILGIIAILLLLIFVLFLYCATIINKHIDEEGSYEERKSNKSKDITNVDTNK